MRLPLVAGAVFALAATTAAHAQDGAPSQAPRPAPAGAAGDGRVIYDAAFFQSFSPVNALQIVQRVPGFTLNIGSGDVRGLANSAGNVVINGQRPSTKSVTLDTVLQRIPASRVERVEVGPGDLFSAEYAGRPQVVNIILKAAGGVAGSVEATLLRSYTGRLSPSGSASGTLKRGRSTFGLSATFVNDQTDQEGYDRYELLPSHDVLEYRYKINRDYEPSLTLGGTWDYDGGTNRTAHLNASWTHAQVNLDQKNFVTPTGFATRDDLLVQDYRTKRWELGGDVTRPLAGGGVKLTVLGTHRREDDLDLVTNRSASVTIGGIGQNVGYDRDERVARTSWTREHLLGLSVEIGAEGAYNRLRSVVDLYAFDARGVVTLIPQPIERATVAEWRGEAFANASRKLSQSLRVDAGVAFEFSRLTVRGDATSTKRLTYLKPRFSIDWTPGKWHFQAAARRTVSQLDFYDFLSTTSLNSDVVNGGNADLEPQRAWEITASAERTILGDGTVRLQLEHDAISQLVDRIPVGPGLDAPGNLPSARRSVATLSVDAPLDRLGLPKFRLTASATITDTSVVDPYTLRPRDISGESLLSGSVSLRRDGEHLAYGITFSGTTQNTVYRVDELDRLDLLPALTPFVEWRPDKKTALTLTVNNALRVGAYRRRTFFDPDRRSTVPVAFEERYRNRYVVPALTFKRSL